MSDDMRFASFNLMRAMLKIYVQRHPDGSNKRDDSDFENQTVELAEAWEQDL